MYTVTVMIQRFILWYVISFYFRNAVICACFCPLLFETVGQLMQLMLAYMLCEDIQAAIHENYMLFVFD